jgi:hypothetical protein
MSSFKRSDLIFELQPLEEQRRQQKKWRSEKADSSLEKLKAYKKT